MTTIKIQKVTPPTEKQANSNIFGTCNLLILSEENNPVAYLNNITIRLNSKTNQKFLAPPGFKYDREGVTKHMNYYSLFPLGDDESKHEMQKESLRALTAEIVRYAENGGTDNSRKTTNVSNQATTNNSDATSKSIW